jgi:Carboxypeptidase regulatory-like domain
MDSHSVTSNKARRSPIGCSLPPHTGITSRLSACLLHFLCPIAIFVFAAVPTLAQNTGSISGTVTDSSGAAVPDASLRLTDVGTSQVRTTTSSAQGYFNFPDIPPTAYRLEVSAANFQKYIFDSLRLTVGQQMSLQPNLVVGGVSQSIQVTGTPPPIQTTTASVGQLIDTQQIDNLPLNGRNALDLVLLVPGTFSAGTAGQFGATQQQFVTGTDANNNNFTLDGGFNMNAFYSIASDYPNPDALQEFVVSTRDYDASLGRGFNSISAITKSGTNAFHGTIYEFFRNTVLDASNYFATAPSPYKRNQFGGTLGGKILTDKLFFFGSYQGTYIRGTPGLYTYVDMTAAERNGDFSSVSSPLIDPTTGKPFPNNQIPSSRILPYASRFISQYLPLPNSGSNLYSFTPASTESANQVITRIDYNMTPKDHIFGRYMFDNIPQVGNGVSYYLDSSWLANLPTRRQSILLNYTRVFSQNLINAATFDYDRDAYGVITRNKFSLTSLGLDINDGNALQSYGLTPDSIIGVAGYFTAGAGVPTRDIVPTTHFSDALSFTHGAHQASVGIEIYHTRVNQLQNYLTDGTMSFSGFATGDAAADFLLGDFSGYEQLTPLITRLRQTLPSFYVQDKYRVSRRLTVTAGLRWDLFFPWISQNNVLGSYIPGRQSQVFPLMAPGLLYPNDPGIPRGVASNRFDNIAPRLGIAWDVRGDGRLSVRLGAGSFYMTSNSAINFNRFPQMPPFGFEANLSAGHAENIWGEEPFNGLNPFPRPDVTDVAGLKMVPFVATTGDTGLGLPFKTQVDHQWSASVQQAIGQGSVLEIAYVGSSASHLLSSFEDNPAVYIPGQSTEANTQQRRINPNIGPINVLSNYLSANYNALEVSFNRRYSNGLSILSSYTWSRALGVVGAMGEGSNGQLDPFDRYLDYGVLPTSVSSNWVTAVVWDFPFAKGLHSRIMRAFLDGWQLNGINTYYTGLPFTVNSGLDNSFSGIGADTADLIGNPHLGGGRTRAQKLSQWFNTGAFEVNTVGTFGNTGIDAFRGPGYWDLDLGAIKHFRLTETKNLEFRSLFYNAPNHPTFANPNATVIDPTFGQINGTNGNSRVIEFAMRLSF